MSRHPSALLDRLDQLSRPAREVDGHDDYPTLPEGATTCTVAENGSVVACRALSSAVEANALQTKRKGVVRWSFIDIATGRTSRVLYGVRSGIHQKHGLVFNHCPWCGTSPFVPGAVDG